MSTIRFSGLCASSMAVALTLLGGIALAPGCSGSGQSAAKELAEQQDVQSDTAPLACEVKWEEVRSDRVQTTDQLTHYTRPFFTNCEEGKFLWDDWEYYPEGLTPEQVALAGHEIKCPSGECKWGICREDAEFIESQIPTGMEMRDGTVGIENASCYPCNPNNKAFYFDKFLYNEFTLEKCEGSYLCCDEPMRYDDNGPCLPPQWLWEYVFISPGDKTFSFVIDVRESDYTHGDETCLTMAEYDCQPRDNARCVHGTATMVTSRWVANYLAGQIDGKSFYAEELRLTIGTSLRLDDFVADPPKECDGSKLRTQYPFTYFTCSGMAKFKHPDGRWFKLVWLHKYDPDNCDKPCWLAADGKGVPVKYAVWEIPAEPKW